MNNIRRPDTVRRAETLPSIPGPRQALPSMAEPRNFSRSFTSQYHENGVARQVQTTNSTASPSLRQPDTSRGGSSSRWRRREMEQIRARQQQREAPSRSLFRSDLSHLAGIDGESSRGERVQSYLPSYEEAGPRPPAYQSNDIPKVLIVSVPGGPTKGEEKASFKQKVKTFFVGRHPALKGRQMVMVYGPSQLGGSS